MLAPVTILSGRAFCAELEHGRIETIKYTGPVLVSGQSVDRTDATGGSAIGVNSGGPYFDQTGSGSTFELAHYFMFLEESVTLDEPGDIFIFLEFGNASAIFAGIMPTPTASKIEYYTHLLSEDYDAAFAWNNDPGRVAGTKTLIWNVDDAQISSTTQGMLWLNGAGSLDGGYIVRASIPAETEVWGIEIAVEAYSSSKTQNIQHYMDYANMPVSEKYPFRDTTPLGTIRQWAGILQPDAPRLPTVPWVLANLDP